MDHLSDKKSNYGRENQQDLLAQLPKLRQEGNSGPLQTERNRRNRPLGRICADLVSSVAQNQEYAQWGRSYSRFRFCFVPISWLTCFSKGGWSLNFRRTDSRPIFFQVRDLNLPLPENCIFFLHKSHTIILSCL